MTDDAHSPTNAGPEPEQADAPPVVEPAPDPTPTVGAGEATFSQPAGTAAGSGWSAPGDLPTGDGAGAGGGAAGRPEILAGAAFAGGFAAAMILKRLGR